MRFPIVQTAVAAWSLFLTTSLAAPYRRNPFTILQKTTDHGVVFTLGNITYLADTKNPKAAIPTMANDLAVFHEGFSMPMTVIDANAVSKTGKSFEDIVENYLAADDVFTMDFLEAVCLTSSTGLPSVNSSVFSQLAAMDAKHVFMPAHLAEHHNHHKALSLHAMDGNVSLPPGPYLLSSTAGRLTFAPVYRLYEDSYRNFLYGAYEGSNGSYTPLDVTYPSFRYPAIPVPSRLYSWNDPRPFAGFRVAIKDLFDMKGLVTSGGSQAWAHINEPAMSNAPSIQRIIDLGGVLVGKYKLAQFASGAHPWDWQDEHYPFNPRGDGWLTCSSSSSGGGCSIAAYDWLDYAIGSDTGSSVRRPAAVSGTYGNRPSQGLMSLEQVLPLGGATDTAGVFSGDPHRWAYFAKHWYTPSLYQSTNTTGLSTLQVPDTNAFPKTILYPTDYLPLNNSAAEPILDNLISNMTSLFGMTVKRINFTATVDTASDPAVANITSLWRDTLRIINTYTQYTEVGAPLIAAWAALFDGRFPPIDPARREPWHTFNATAVNQQTYNEALRQKKAAVEWYESQFQYSTPESCSESVLLYDIGTGGLPSYREEELNNNPLATYADTKEEGAAIPGATICPL